MNERKKSHISIYFTRIFSSSSGQQSHFPVLQPISLFSASCFISLPLTNNSFILFASLSSAAFREFSINSLSRESNDCFTPSLFCSHSLISLSKVCSVSFKLCSFCFYKKVLLFLGDLLQLVVEWWITLSCYHLKHLYSDWNLFLRLLGRDSVQKWAAERLLNLDLSYPYQTS